MDSPGIHLNSPQFSTVEREGAAKTSAKRQQRSDSPAPDDNKRPKLQHATVSVIQTPKGYFLPKDFFEQESLLAPLDSATQKALHEFESRTLETATSEIHNQGVFLKKNATPIAENQICAVLDGHLLRKRALTYDERESCGISEPSSERYLTWSLYDNTEKVSWRLPSYQIFTDNIYCQDSNNQWVYMGLELIDSPLPISNINHSKQLNNILLMGCIDDGAILSVSDEGIHISADITPDQYCIVAVAGRNIAPGEELLLNYDNQIVQSQGYFWDPEKYLYPPLAPKPVTLEQSDRNTFQFESITTPIPPSMVELRQLIEGMLLAGIHFEYIALDLNQKHIFNPLFKQYFWFPGSVQYLCHLLNIPTPQQAEFSELSYLYHSLSPEGQLDNVAKNYLQGYLKKSDLSPSLYPDPLPATLKDLNLWLEFVNSQLASPRPTRLQNEQNYLRCWLNNDFPSIQPIPENMTDEQKHLMMLFLTTVQELYSHQLSNNRPEKSIQARLQTRAALPDQCFPEHFRASQWREAHTRLLPRLLDIDLNNSILEKHADRDILVTYRSDHPDYLPALKRYASKLVSQGRSAQAIRAMMQSGHIGNSGTTAGNAGKEAYPIPHSPDIRTTLHGTTQWSDLSDTEWTSLLGEESLGNLKASLEEMGCDDRSFTHLYLRRDRYKLWHPLPCIKDEIKQLKPQSKDLVSYLAYVSGAELSSAFCPMLPIRGLRICAADTPHYDECMKRLLLQCKEERWSITKLLDTLTQEKPEYRPSAHASNEYFKAMAIEIPAELRSEHDTWTQPLIEALCKKYEIAHDFATEAKSDIGQTLEDFQETMNGWNAKTWFDFLRHFQGHLKHNPDFSRLISVPMTADINKIKSGSASAVRCIMKHFSLKFILPKNEMAHLEPTFIDQLNITPCDHPHYEEHLMSVLTYYLNQGHTLTYIAYRLDTGHFKCSLNNRELKLEPVSLPATLFSHYGEWSYEALQDFLLQQGRNLDALKEHFPSSAQCLKVEQCWHAQHSKISIKDGLLINQMLSPCVKGATGTEKKLIKIRPEKIGLILGNDRVELMERYQTIIEATSPTPV